MGGAEIIWLRKRNSGCETGVCESGVQRRVLAKGLCLNFIFILDTISTSHLPPSAVKSTQNNDARRRVCYHTTDVATDTCNSTLFYGVTASGGMTIVYNDSHGMTIILHVTSVTSPKMQMITVSRRSQFKVSPGARSPSRCQHAFLETYTKIKLEGEDLSPSLPSSTFPTVA